MDEFLEDLKKCKWGLCPKGKIYNGMDCKNRREVEYSSLGYPLVLNYKPVYPFEFEPMKQYVYIKDFTNLELLDEIDPRPFAEQSKNVYANHFSPNGLSRTLMDVIKDKL
jgi:hypothetical protein